VPGPGVEEAHGAGCKVVEHPLAISNNTANHRYILLSSVWNVRLAKDLQTPGRSSPETQSDLYFVVVVAVPVTIRNHLSGTRLQHRQDGDTQR
jgi:hypothetical protein